MEYALHRDARRRSRDARDPPEGSRRNRIASTFIGGSVTHFEHAITAHRCCRCLIRIMRDTRRVDPAMDRSNRRRAAACFRKASGRRRGIVLLRHGWRLGGSAYRFSVRLPQARVAMQSAAPRARHSAWLRLSPCVGTLVSRHPATQSAAMIPKTSTGQRRRRTMTLMIASTAILLRRRYDDLRQVPRARAISDRRRSRH